MQAASNGLPRGRRRKRGGAPINLSNDDAIGEVAGLRIDERLYSPD